MADDLTKLLKRKLTEPIFLKVARNLDGDLSIQQIQFLDTEEVAALAKVSERTVRSWVERQLLPYYKPEGSSRNLFEINETIEYLMRNRIECRPHDNGQ